MSLTKDDIPFTVIHSFRRLESETKENENFQIDDIQSVKRKLDFSDEALGEDHVTPDKPKSVYKSQLHDRWKKKLRIQDLPEQATSPTEDGKIQPRKRDLKLAKKENNKLRTVSEMEDETEPKQRTFAPKIVQRRLQLNIPGTGSGLG